MKISTNTSPTVRHLKEVALSKGSVTVGTHDGCWHADELLAIAIIREALPGVRVNVVRSRSTYVLGKTDIIVDVGGGALDHHGNCVRSYPNGIPYAACGLTLEAIEPNRALINILNQDLIYGVSAKDNGYHDPRLGSILQSKLDWVGYFYPTWQEREIVEESEIMARFYKVLDMVSEVYRRIRTNAAARIAAEDILPSLPTFLGGQFIELPRGGVPWAKYGYEHPEVLGAFYRDDDNRWVVRVARSRPDNAYDNRVLFPAEWRGLDRSELRYASRIPDILFVHRTGFMATFESRDGAERAMRVLEFVHKSESN